MKPVKPISKKHDLLMEKCHFCLVPNTKENMKENQAKNFPLIY